MCLDINHPNPKIERLEKDMVVYKVVILSEGKMQTPYQEMKVDFNILYSLNKPFLIKNLSTYSTVAEGFHSMIRMIDALALKDKLVWDFLNDYEEEDVQVVKCIIPKGSFIIKGMFGNWDACVSDNIEYLKFINH